MNGGALLSALLTILIFGATAQAQRSAFVMGRVLDLSGAAVPDARLPVGNRGTGFRRARPDAEDGTYLVASLEPGLYKVTVRKEGFIGMIRFDVRVAPTQGARADFNLIVGAVQETITVEGTAPLVSREDVVVGAQVFHEDIQRVPL